MPQQQPCAAKCMKLALLLLNLLFVIIGLILIGVGIYFKVDDKFSALLSELADVSNFEGQSLGFLAFALIGGGVFALIIALCGCLGTWWNSRCLLYTYAVVISVVMIIEFIGFIFVFAYRSKVESVYRDSLGKVFIEALKGNKEKVLKPFHDLEKKLGCCGVNGRQDYTDAGLEGPPICYTNETATGCSTLIINWLNDKFPIIGGTLGAVLLLELLCLLSAIVLAAALKTSYVQEDLSMTPEEVISIAVPGRRRNYYKLK